MSKRFGRRRRQRMRDRIVELEAKCKNLQLANDSFIREHRALYSAIDDHLPEWVVGVFLDYVRERLK